MNAVKINLMALKAMEDTLKICTFTPTINEGRSPRSFNEFLKEQDRKKKSKEQMVQELAAEKTKAENATLQKCPHINEVFVCCNKCGIVESSPCYLEF